jgi:hypothetical protein
MSQVVSSGPLDLLESCSRLHTLNLFGNNPKTEHEDPFTEWTRKIEQSYRVCHPPSIDLFTVHPLHLLTIPCTSAPSLAPPHHPLRLLTISYASSPTVASSHHLLHISAQALLERRNFQGALSLLCDSFFSREVSRLDCLVRRQSCSMPPDVV